jgi:hypothetical protein
MQYLFTYKYKHLQHPGSPCSTKMLHMTAFLQPGFAAQKLLDHEHYCTIKHCFVFLILKSMTIIWSLFRHQQ